MGNLTGFIFQPYNGEAQTCLKRKAQPGQMDKTDQERANTPELVMPAKTGPSETDPPAMAAPTLEMADGAKPGPEAEQQWDNATEQEWSEHSATAWALAHVIHHIRSTPLPPFLLPEQRRHFHKIIQMAASLIEDWQRRERAQAQHLALGRPVTGLPAEPEALGETD